MISFLKGTLAARSAESAVIEVGGVGFTVGMSANSLARLPEVGAEVQVYTYLQVREDALTLFGFASLEEKALFERLIGVSGVGPKVALSALSSYSPTALSDLVVSGDVAGVSRIPGIGKKTAQRIILELQGILEQDTAGQLPLEGAGGGASSAVRGATEALLSMGFTGEEANLALKGAPASASESALLQYALKRLGS